MEQHFKSYLQSSPLAFGLLLIATVSNILSSAKWGMGLFGWISPIGFLFFVRFSVVRWKWVILFIVLVLASVIDAKDVAPFPIPFLIILGLVESGKILLVYLTNEWLYKKESAIFSNAVFARRLYVSGIHKCKIGRRGLVVIS